MVASLLLLIVIVDTAATAYLLGTIKGLKKTVAHNAKLIKAVIDEDSDGRDTDHCD